MPVEEIGGGMKRLNPIDGWQAALKKQGAHNIINGAKSALGFTVLLRGVGARHAKNGTVREEERAGRGVVKLAAIVTLDSLNGGAKLCGDVGKKVGKLRKGVRFKP